MAKPRRPPSQRLSGSGVASPVSLEGERHPYTDRQPGPESPGEIVARLHERMSGDPRFAKTVAVYDDVKAGRREPLTPREIELELGRAAPLSRLKPL